MKKETIFKHELNESIQAKAAMNCLKNRNNKQVVANQEQEEDYTNDEIPSPNFSYRMSFMVWAMREIIPYLKEISQVCAQADPTELKHAVMKILKTRDTGIPETPRSCQQWAKQNYDWVEMELNGEYDSYQEKWSKPFNIPSEQEEEVDVFELAVEVAQKNASKIARMSEQNACGVLMNELCKLTNRDFDTLDEEGDFDYYQDAALYGYASVVGYDDEQEEMEVTDAKHALAQLAAELLHYDDGDLDELYYAISDIIDSEGYSPQPDEYEMWIEEHVNEIEDLIM